MEIKEKLFSLNVRIRHRNNGDNEEDGQDI